MKVIVSRVYLWSDFMTVLSWTHKESMNLIQCVQNRVATIQENCTTEQWRRIGSEQNAADVLSRGRDSERLLNCDLWWRCPTFLADCDYPCRPILVSETNVEFNIELKISLKTLKNINKNNFSITANYFVNDLTILHILTGDIVRFGNSSTNPLYKSGEPLSTMEILQAENHLRKLKKQEFSACIRSLQLRCSVTPNSKLKNLNSFLDENGVLRV